MYLEKRWAMDMWLKSAEAVSVRERRLLFGKLGSGTI